MTKFGCPYLGARVELSVERERHIALRHPDLLPAHRSHLATTLADPDQIRRSPRFPNAKLFARWYDDLVGGKHVVVVVVTSNRRHWIVTAYIARRLVEGQNEWARS